MKLEPKFNLITLGVKDLQKSIDFYEKGLGWEKSNQSQESVAFFQLAGIVLSLFPRESLAEDAGINPMGSGFSGFTLAYNTRSEKEVDEVFTFIEKIGGTIIKRPGKVFWGGYSGYFSDPDGFLIEVAYNPFFEMDEKGLLKI
jgi:uncharacterized protein